jgi:hypothetical protein
MPMSLEARVLVEDDPDVVFGQALVECWIGRVFADEEDYRRGRKRFYAAASSGKVPVSKQAGIGWRGRRSEILLHRRELIARADREARERVGMAPQAA